MVRSLFRVSGVDAMACLRRGRTGAAWSIWRASLCIDNGLSRFVNGMVKQMTSAKTYRRRCQSWIKRTAASGENNGASLPLGFARSLQRGFPPRCARQH